MPTKDHKSGMSIERWLQISLATLTALGTLLLGLGQESPALPMMAVFASVVSVIFTDSLAWFRLNRVLANLAALGAAVFSLSNFWFNDSEHQLMSIAHLLVYLQVILLFQQKTYRIYWELAVLSLLQVVVAAALNLGVSFGMMLAPYTVVAIFALSLFYLHRENRRFGPQEVAKPVRRRKTAKTPVLNAVAASVTSSAGRVVRSSRVSGDPQTWPKHALAQASLLGVLDFKPVASPTQLRTGPLDVLLGKRLLRQIGGLAIATGFFTVVVFFATPRQSDAVWRGPANRQHALVGFSKEVSLGKMRDVLQDDATAMRVSLTYVDTGEPYETVREPYFRGAVLSEYISRGGEGTWRRVRDLTPNPLDRRGGGMHWGDRVRQEYWLEPRGDSESLFAIYPALAVDEETPPEVVVDRRRQQVFRLSDDDRAGNVAFNYVLEAAAFDDRWQRAVTLRDPAFDTGNLSSNFGGNDRDRFPELRKLAQEILAKDDVDPSNNMRTAYALEGYFRDASKFTYSLDLSRIEQTPGLDPIVDFALNHRTGHCQYFASAVALMLRTLDIPSRLIIGYKGGEYNKLANSYLVRERHAHVWVEVFLPPDELGEDMIPKDIIVTNGAWLRIDPTPSSDPGRLPGSASMFSRAGDVLDYARILWADYVLGLNAKRQQDSIYQPLSSRLGDALSSAIESSSFWDATVKVFDKVGIDLRGLSPRSWFDWRASLAAIFVCLAGFAAYRAAISQWPRLGFWFTRRKRAAPTRRAPVIEFYRRMETILARAHLTRRSTQTQREFAAFASGILRDRTLSEEAAAAPLLVAEFFYRVRFGGDELSAIESERVTQSLAALELALATK